MLVLSMFYLNCFRLDCILMCSVEGWGWNSGGDEVKGSGWGERMGMNKRVWWDEIIGIGRCTETMT